MEKDDELRNPQFIAAFQMLGIGTIKANIGEVLDSIRYVTSGEVGKIKVTYTSSVGIVRRISDLNKIYTKEQSKLIEHYTRLYEYQEDDFRNSNLRKMVLKHVSGKRVLEIGCGTGHLTLSLLKHGFSVTAIDVLQEMLEFTKYTTKGYQGQVQIVKLKAEEMHKLKPKMFDLVVCIDVLEHVEFDVQLLLGIHDILSERGRLLLVVPAHKHLYGIRDREMGHFRRYSRTEILHKMAHCGFTIKKARFWNFIGVLPYFISEKIFKRRVNENLRYSRRSPLASGLNFLLNKWFALFENHFNVGMGLSLFIIAEKSNTNKR